jgi:hypothetical protein
MSGERSGSPRIEEPRFFSCDSVALITADDENQNKRTARADAGRTKLDKQHNTLSQNPIRTLSLHSEPYSADD